MTRTLGLALIVGGLALVGGTTYMLAYPPAGDPPQPITGEALGTTYRVIYSESSGAPIDRHVATVSIAAELDSIDRVFSAWRSDSFVSQFNEAPVGKVMPSTTGFVDLLQRSNALRERTGGAFDVGIGRLTELWRLAPIGSGDLPDPQAIDAARAAMRQFYLEGERGFRADDPSTWPQYCEFGVATRNSFTKLGPAGIEPPRLDFSAIAKGYAVDRIAETLDALGATGYLVEVGGEVRVKGTRTIGIEAPDPNLRRIMLDVRVTDAALATSGDYRNFVVRDGKRYSHIIDPRTGYPIDHDLASASVIAPTCAEADALATALMVMGPAEARDFAEREKLGVLLISRVKDPDGSAAFATWMSPQWPK